jgi:hypothetical protein
MSAYHTAFVSTVAAGFSSEARCVGDIFSGKISFCEYFISVERNERCFCCGEHKVAAFFLFAFFEPVYLIGKFGELTCCKTAFVAEHMGNENELEAVLEMCIYKVVEE